jgi:zinc/manganese transport system substrate-binding protein
MMKKLFGFLSAVVASLALPAAAHAKLNVVATTTDLKALVKEVGGDLISVDAIAKGTQDPHYIEAKPSYMTKTSHADLVVAVGLDLEVGWLPSILNGARNPKVRPGNKGYLELGQYVDALEVPTGKVTRAEGDVHPFGNPHFYLDPIRMGKLASVVAERLGELDTDHAAEFTKRAEAFNARMEKKTKEWLARIKKSNVKAVVTYHKTLTYFFDRFELQNPAILEPKPGIPPTSGHILEVIQLIKQKKIPLLMIENFFDPTVSNRIVEDVPGVRVAVVPVSVDGAPGTDTLDDLYEKLVSVVAGK